MGINQVVSVSKNGRKMVESNPLKLLAWKAIAMGFREMRFLPCMLLLGEILVIRIFSSERQDSPCSVK